MMSGYYPEGVRPCDFDLPSDPLEFVPYHICPWCRSNLLASDDPETRGEVFCPNGHCGKYDPMKTAEENRELYRNGPA